MSRESVEVVCDQFAAVNERDFPRAMSYYAEDVELVVHPQAFLERGTFKGREAVGEWFGNWFGKVVRAELYPSRAHALDAAGPGASEKT